ncbi:MAG: sugar ABC transporter permease [Chloroflexota bacterium]|nr:sugar ABC transporter permease [Chloroflexota bacterium]
MQRSATRSPTGAVEPGSRPAGWSSLADLRLPTLSDRTLAYLLLLPSVLLILTLVVLPFVQAFFYSFTDKHTVSPDWEFIGLDNYLSFFRQPDFPEAFKNSVVWTVGSVAIELVLGLYISLVLQRSFKLRGLARAIVLFPYLIPTIVAVLVWRFMMHDLLGVVNYGLIAAGVIQQPILWFSNTDTAMMGVIIVGVWKFFPFVVIALLGILQSIPSETFEAAKMDGANVFQEFRYITLPAILPVFLLTALLRTIWTWDKFDIIYLLTGGGPVNATTTLPIFVYREAFDSWRMGRASAVAMVTFMVLLLCTLVYLRFYEKAEGATR